MGIIDVIFVIILGIIEGITEWLPISSTAHLLILEKMFLPSSFTPEFLLLIDVVIQLGAIMACVCIYFKKLYPFGFNESPTSKGIKIGIWKKIIISLMPLVFLGLLLDDIVVELFYNLFTISIMLVLYGVLIIIFDNYNKKKQKEISIEKISNIKAFLVGLVQVLAIIPGTSRSGVTILFAGILGLERKVAVEYSFFLAIPIMFGASLLKGFKYFINHNIVFNEIILLLIATFTAFIVSMFVLKTLINLIKKINFKVFGFYRIVLGIIILLLIL